MEKLLISIGEFLAVDCEDVKDVSYFEGDETRLVVKMKNDEKILLELSKVN